MAEGPGYSVAAGRCLCCGNVFTFNPELVPSHPARGGEPSTNPTDPKEPICSDCIVVVNAARRKDGNPEWPVPEGAYEPMEGWPS